MKAYRAIIHLSSISRLKAGGMKILLLCGLCISFVASGQEYGLEFAGQPVVKDLRTKLDLQPTGYYSFRGGFELSFSIQIRGIQPTTFGYIARIVDAEGNNVDIIFNGPQSHSLQVVYGESLTNISLPDNDPGIYEMWTLIRLKYDKRNRSLSLFTPDTSLVQKDIDISRKIKIFFGRNEFNPVQTTDVPRMNIKDIRIYQKGKCLHHFPLDEISGNEARDIISNKLAIVQNPGWIKPGYYNWKFSFVTFMHGTTAMCYEPGNERVYLVGDEQLKVFSVLKDSIEDFDYNTRFSEFIRGSQVFYDTLHNRLISYNLERKTVHYFDFSKRIWERISDGPNVPARFWFHNKYYSNADSALYIFGGYSQHKYYSMVQRYNFWNNQWDTVRTQGEVFHPRMHAAIGNFKDTLYFLGGFGSRMGEQILKPEHYKDLMAFSLKENKFVKKYNFRAGIEDIDFAHSMIIDGEDLSYYVLATTIFDYETYLQILKGKLSDPELISLGDKIPYLFHNENSYSDLYYSKSSQELIAATSLVDSERNETEINVYKISFPPHPFLTEPDEHRKLLGIVVLPALVFILLVTTLILLFSKWKMKRHPSGISEKKRVNDKAEKDLLNQNGSGLNKPKVAANTILFFGGFQVINRHGDDITKKFTPLLKELFLLIFLYSIKDKGISVPRLSELLWFSMDAKTAKNNRAVNIAKLKNLLSEIDSCILSRNTGYWQIIFNDSIVYNDYWSCMKSINQENSLREEDLLNLLCITKKGLLLGNASYEWLDEFKLECSNMIIDSLSHYIEHSNIESNPELIIQVTDVILIFDIMHEEAIALKCKSLTKLGKHSLAKEIFAKFSKDYSNLYDEPFRRSFTDIIRD